MANKRTQQSIENEIEKLKRQTLKKPKVKKATIPSVSAKTAKTPTPKTKNTQPPKQSKANLQKRKIKYWYDVYSKALQLFNVYTKPVKNPSEKTLDRLRRKWKLTTYDKDISLTVREAYKSQVNKEQAQADYNDTPRDMDYRTETATNMYDISMEIIQSFIDRVEQIYEETMASPQSGNNSDVDWLILKYGGEITASKDELIGFVWQMYEDCNQQVDYVAQAIQENEELEYTIAIAFVPPSDCIFLFYETLNHLRAIWERIVNNAREIAESELN